MMILQALYIMGLAMAGVTFTVVAAATAAHDQDEDKQQIMHQLNQDNQDPSDDDLLQLGENNNNSSSQILDTNHNLNEDVPNKKEQRQIPLLIGGCGGEYNTTIGMIRHPSSGGHYENNERCSWIIEITERITIRFTQFETHKNYDILHIRDGSSSESRLLGSYSGSLTDGSFPCSVTTSSTAAHLFFTTSRGGTNTGFVLHWEPAVATFYQIPVGIDYEVGLKFSLTTGYTALNWLYGPSFGEMPNTLQIPSDNGKFTASLIDLENNMYQAVLKIAGITEDDFDTNFMLQVTNEVEEANYRVMLFESGPPPPSVPTSDDIMPTSVRITVKFDNVIPGDISSYTIQYKPKDHDQNYTQVTGLLNNYYTVRGLTPSTEYEFLAVVDHQLGRGPPSNKAYVTTKEIGCGGEYNTTIGSLRHPLSAGYYQNSEHCTWIIKTVERITLIFTRFQTEINRDILHIQDGSSTDSALIGSFSGSLTNGSFPSSMTTSSTAAYLGFISGGKTTDIGFELHWEPAVETFYQVPIGSDYEVSLNFSVNPGPTTLEWSYGPDFEDIPNIIQIPSDNGKFSTSWIDMQDNNYHAILKITRITQDDFETKFKLHVTNEIGETYYRVMLTAFPRPPVIVQISNITASTVFVTWDYNGSPGDNTSYVLQYRQRNTDQDYTGISGLATNSYTITGLITEYEIRVLAMNQMGLGPPSESSYVATRCGGEYNITMGSLRHPLSGGNYQDNETCIWIIKTVERMTLIFTRFQTERKLDILHVRDGSSSGSALLGSFSGSLTDGSIPSSVTTSSAAAHLVFTTDAAIANTGFELHWEPAVDTFYQVPIGSDYEVRLNFSVNPEPTVLKWSYGPNFQDMPYIIQIPSDKRKFTTSLIDLQDKNYQAILKINGITQDDFETKFKLHVTNEIGETYYRVMLSAFSSPPSSVWVSDVMPEAVKISWEYNSIPRNISSYVIQYKPMNSTNQDYTEIPHIHTMIYTFRGLTPSTEYVFRVLAVDQLGRGLPSEKAYVPTTETGCGGEYNSSSGSLHHPLSGGKYRYNENCIWIIRAAGPIHITFQEFHTQLGIDHLYISDGVSRDESSLHKLTGIVPTSPSVELTTTSNAAHLHFTSCGELRCTGPGFKLHWETAEIQVVVNPSESVELECGFEGNYRFCLWEKDGNTIQVEDVYKGIYPGLGRPEIEKLNQQCSIVVESASEMDHGTWICKIYIKGNILQDNTKIVLTEVPYAAKVSPQQITINTGERAFPKCVVRSARPAADISWTLNGRNITMDAIVKNTQINSNGSYKTESTLSIDFNLAKHGQMLKCEVTHHALSEPEIISLPITVLGFEPIQRRGEVNTLYNISIGIHYEIQLGFSVRPVLTGFKWYYGPNFQERSNIIQIPSESNKTAASFIELNNGTFQVLLKIKQITEEDIKTRFTLQVENGISQANYRIMLSKNENPSECSENFVMSYDAKHCFQIFLDFERNYTDAQKKCKDEGLMLVQLSDEDAADVRNMLLDEYGDRPVWLDARGNNQTMAWNRTQTEIKFGSSLWWPKTPRDLMSGPGDWLDRRWCLLFLVYGTNWNIHPGRPYQPFICDRKLWTLCEAGDPPKPKQVTSTSSATKKLDYYCSGGWFFTSEGSSKCFVRFKDELRSWDDAQRMCGNEGLLMAKPTTGDEAIALRRYLLDKYGDGRVWMGARANGTHYLWEKDRSELSIGSPLWQRGKNRGPWDDCHSHLGPKCYRTTPNHCLTLRVTRTEWSVGPDRPYASYECSIKQYTLCEHKGCADGFFSLEGSNQCFKVFDEAKLNWTAAASKCRDEGLRLAQPLDQTAPALMKYLLDTSGDGSDVWLGARRQTVGSEALWQQRHGDQTVAPGNNSSSSISVAAVNNSSSNSSISSISQQGVVVGSGVINSSSSMGIPRGSGLWVPWGGPDGGVFSSQDDLCLLVVVWQASWEFAPDQTYALNPCAKKNYPLCEAVDPELE